MGRGGSRRHTRARLAAHYLGPLRRPTPSPTAAMAAVHCAEPRPPVALARFSPTMHSRDREVVHTGGGYTYTSYRGVGAC